MFLSEFRFIDHWLAIVLLYSQISALLEHRSQYTNATAVAESVRSMGANIARQVGKSGYAEGFTWIPQLP